jgi:arginase family enzyme
MDLSVFFQPLEPNVLGASDTLSASCTVHTENNFPDFENARVAIIGVRSGDGSKGNESCAKGPDAFREKFYSLSPFKPAVEIVDLGNIDEGAEQKDTEFAIRETCAALMKIGVIPIVIGGGHHLSYASYAAYEQLEQTVNLVTVDNKLDIGEISDHKDNSNFLSHIILHKPNILFNFSNIGQQRSLVNPELLDLMEKMYFDTYRLGEVSGNILDMEPVIRNADLMSFDMNAIRAADAMANANAGPNGLFGQEACQLCRYAGISDRLSSVGFYEFNPDLDERGLSAQLLAEMVWYFIEGVSLRKGEYPKGDLDEYYKYIIELEDHQLVFYKSNKSDRWWMDVPYPAGMRNKYERHHIVPCTYSDYLTASNEDVPDRWWKTYQKLV